MFKKNIYFGMDGGIGDIVVSMAVVDEMKRLNPDIIITVGCRGYPFLSIVELNPNIDFIVPYPDSVDDDLKSFENKKMELEEKYDKVVFFNPPDQKDHFKLRRKIKQWLKKQGWTPDRRHMIERYSDKAEIQVKNKRVKFYFDDEDQELANNFLKENGISSNDLVIFISHRTGGSQFLRNWPIKNFEQLVNRILSDTKCKVIVSGCQDDPTLNNVSSVIYALGFPLRPTACLIKRSNLFIGMDSGLTHIASCFDCDIVSIHSGFPVFETGALSGSITFVHNGPYKRPEIISVDQVYEAVQEKISKNKTTRV